MTCRECGGITSHNPAGCQAGHAEARKALAMLVASPLPIPRREPETLVGMHARVYEYDEDLRTARSAQDKPSP